MFILQIQILLPWDFKGGGWGVDTQKIKLLKLSWASRFLLHNNYKLFCFYYKFIFCFPMSLRVVLILKNKATKSQLRTSVKSLDTRWCCWCCYSKNKATQAQLSLAEFTGSYYTIIINFFVFTRNSCFAFLRIWGWWIVLYPKNKATHFEGGKWCWHYFLVDITFGWHCL